MRSPQIIFTLALILLFLLPLLVWERFMFPSTFAKTFFFTALVEVMFLFWLPGAYVRLKNRAVSPVSVFMALFFGIMALSAFLGADFYQSIWSNYERMMGLWTFGHLILFFLIVATTVTRESQWVWLFRVAAISSLIVSFVGIDEFLKTGTAFRIESTLKNSAFLASYLLLAIFINLWLFLREERFVPASFLWGLGVVLSFSVIILTGTRGAMLATAAGFMLLGALFLFLGPAGGFTLSLKNSVLKKLVSGFLIAFVLLVGTGIVFKEKLAMSSFSPLARVASLSFSTSTIKGRLLAWDVSWQGWKERPFLGWGPENYNLLFNAHYDPRLIDQEPWFDRAHNFIFDIGVTTGFLGLFSYLGVFVAALWILFSRWRQKSISFWMFAVFSSTLIAHLLQNLFVFDMLTSFTLLFLIFAFIHSRANQSFIEAASRAKSSLPLFFLGIIVIAPLFYMGIWKPFQENRMGRSGFDAFAAWRDTEAIQYVEKALSYNTYGNVDVRRSAAEYVFEFLKRGGERNPESLKRVIDYAILKMEENILEKPQDVKWYMYQGELYNLGAAMLEEQNAIYAQNAEKRFLEAKELSPGRPQIYLEIAQARKIRGDYKGLWEILDEIMELLPDHSLLHTNALIHAIEIGDGTRETQELEWLFTNDINFNREIIVDAYFTAGRLDKAIEVELSQIQYSYDAKNREDDYNPKSIAKYYAVLAALYKRAGMYDNAREAAHKAVELDPSQKESAEAFLRTFP